MHYILVCDIKGWLEQSLKWLLENFEAARIDIPTSNFHSLRFFYLLFQKNLV